MRTDPEPDDLVPLSDSQGAIAERDANGVDRTSIVDLLEPKARVLWIPLKQAIRRTSTATHMHRQPG